MPDSLMVRRALDAILAPAGADSASTKEDTVVVRDTLSVLTDSLVIMSAVKDTVIADSIDAAAAREDTIAEEYQLSPEMRDSIHKKEEAIKAALNFLSGVQQSEIRVGKKQYPTLFLRLIPTRRGYTTAFPSRRSPRTSISDTRCVLP